MPTIDLIVTRHGKKQPVDKRGYPGDAIDRSIPLSDEGKDQAYRIGESELCGKRYSRVIVVTSGFKRTRDTADAVLEGAGMDPAKLYEDPAHARFSTDNHLGFGGPGWVFPEGSPKFGDDLDTLRAHISYGLREHFLQREDAAHGQYPIMARHAAAVLRNIDQGVNELDVELMPDERGLLVVATHAHPIDAAAAWLTRAVRLTPLTGEEFPDCVYGVKLLEPYVPHAQGEFFSGTFSGDVLRLQIKGNTHTFPFSHGYRTTTAQGLLKLATRGVQRTA